jgi:hypothetical protein
MSKRSQSPEPEHAVPIFQRLRTVVPTPVAPGVPNENDAIKMYLEGQYPSPEYLNALLLDPYQSFEDFHIRNYIPNIPNLVTSRQYTLPRHLTRDTPYEEYAICKLDDATRFYNESFTEAFTGFDWNNVCIAGGFVLRMLGAYDQAHNFYSQHDIDLFIYGLNEQQGMQKLQQIIQHFQGLGKFQYRTIARSERAITILIPECSYPIQIILRLYHHPTEILLGFDLPCVKALFDGQRFLMTQSAKQAIIQRCNIANGYQPFRTGTYEYRLYKYYKRGYAVQVPDFRPDRVDMNIFKFGFEEILQLTGLARLLFMIRYNKDIPREEIMVGDYDPVEMTMSKLHDAIIDAQRFEDDETILAMAYQLTEIYKSKPYFIFELDRQHWHRLFDGTWTLPNAVAIAKRVIAGYKIKQPNGSTITTVSDEHWTRFLESHNIPSEVGPLRFIGSLVEYLQSLPKVNLWYCQAYGVKTQDC